MQSFIKRQKIAHCYVQCKLIKGYHWILAKCKIMQTGVFLLNLAQPHPICSLRGKTTTPGPAVISADKVRNLGCKNLRSRLNSGLMFLPCTLNANLRNSQYKVIIFGAPWAWPGCCSVVRVLCGGWNCSGSLRVGSAKHGWGPAVHTLHGHRVLLCILPPCISCPFEDGVCRSLLNLIFWFTFTWSVFTVHSTIVTSGPSAQLRPHSCV